MDQVLTYLMVEMGICQFVILFAIGLVNYKWNSYVRELKLNIEKVDRTVVALNQTRSTVMSD